MKPTPTHVLLQLDQGRIEQAHRLLREAFHAGPPVEGTDAWARAAEAAGLSLLALQAWQAALSQERDHAEALRHLARLHEDRGDARRAAACRQRLKDLLGADPEPDGGALPAEADETPAPPMGEPGDGDLVRFVHLFGGREGVHARQWYQAGQGGGYSPVEAPLTPNLVRAHLRGGVTLGSYVVRRDDRVGQLVFDLDASKAAVERAYGDAQAASVLRRTIHEAGLALLQGLRTAGLDPLLVDSGYKGRHLWCLFPAPEAAARARAVGRAWALALTPASSELTVEVFPKQDRVPPGGLGNLIKLPLGIHRRTGRRCVLLDDRGQPLDDPWERVRSVRKVPLTAVRLPPPRLIPRGGVAKEPPVEPGPVDTPGGDDASSAADPIPSANLRAAFSEADLHAMPRLDAVLTGCAVLGEVVRRALDEARLERGERIVLEHALGHLPEGVEAVNYLLRRCGVDEKHWMKSPHSGCVISCKGVRRRAAHVAREVPCDCSFDHPESYPHPVLHAHGIAARPQQAERSLPELLDALRRSQALQAGLEEELRGLRREAAGRVAEQPGGRFVGERGAWEVKDHEGIPALSFRARETG